MIRWITTLECGHSWYAYFYDVFESKLYQSKSVDSESELDELEGHKVKPVINEAIVKDNISKAGMANAILSQEFCKKVKDNNRFARIT
ncbi:23286_t:CDS:2 [Gigaspora rosea]|nr:23286_t:CDS:2 [Gigaspora rosea]